MPENFPVSLLHEYSGPNRMTRPNMENCPDKTWWCRNRKLQISLVLLVKLRGFYLIYFIKFWDGRPGMRLARVISQIGHLQNLIPF